MFLYKLCNSILILDIGLDVVSHPRNRQAGMYFLIVIYLSCPLGNGELREILVQLRKLTKFLGVGVLGLLGKSLSQGDGAGLVVNV